MELLTGDPEYKSSSALLGIHCAISYSDALRTGMGGGDLTSDDHGSAANDLEKLLASRSFARLEGAEQLRNLLRRKSRIAYSPQVARDNEIEDTLKKAKRFANWAEETGTKLKIEGW
jgi:hypothetical protein